MAIIDKPSDFFNTKLWTGTGNAQTISGVGFQPDLSWSKGRNYDYAHQLIDSVRGITKQLNSNDDQPEGTNANGITAFNSDGFVIGTQPEMSSNGKTFASWNWKAGTSFTNDASSTGIGTIDSTGSASDTSGFSIVSYTGTGSAGTIKHGLSTAPDLFIIKRRDSANDWRVGSSALTNFVKHVNLNTTAAESDLAAAFNSTGPTTSVFSVGTSVSTNASSGTYIAYCFASINSYSKFSSYIGNGNADGTFVYLGFKPAFVMIKSSSNSGQAWVMQDNKRDGFNYNNHRLFANSSATEESTVRMDLLSNGFKCRDNDGNGNGFTYIFMAFAENPFVASNFNPATAR